MPTWAPGSAKKVCLHGLQAQQNRCAYMGSRLSKTKTLTRDEIEAETNKTKPTTPTSMFMAPQRVAHEDINSCPLLSLPGEGNGDPLQYSCLENPMDGGAWWAAVPGVANSRTGLSNFTFTFHFCALEKEMVTPVFLPGESQGRGCLVGCRLWGHMETDTTEAT